MAAIGDDGYSDDDLDALASEDFLELQEQALQATQNPNAPHQHLLLRGQPISQSEVDLVTKDASTTRPKLPPQLPSYAEANGKQNTRSQTAHLKGTRRTAPADEATRREQWRLQRFGPQNTPGYSVPQLSTASQRMLPHRSQEQATYEDEDSTGLQIESGPDIEDDVVMRDDRGEYSGFRKPQANDEPRDERLQTTVKQLLLDRERWQAERASLEKDLKTVTSQLQIRSGEISILRSNHAQQVQDRERTLEELRRQQHIQDERYRIELEQIRKEKEKLVIQNRFLDHENNERSFHSRTSKKAAKNIIVPDGNSTPKRTRSGFGDGFEDTELEMLSPSKIASRPKAATPKHGSKRKRDILNLSPMDIPVVDNESFSTFKPSPHTEARPAPANIYTEVSPRSGFLHRLLFHRRRTDEPRVFEKLVKFNLPAEPNISLAELFMDKVPPTTPASEEDVPASYGLIVSELWSQCLSQGYYEPISSLIDLLRFILQNGTMATAVRLLDDIVSLGQRTADINIIPRFKKLNKNAKVITVHFNDQTIEDSQEIDTQQCLELLYMAALCCARDHNAMTRFWHCMRFDFISMVLRVIQTIDDIILMVRLLRTCVVQDCFQAIKPPSPDGDSAEQHVIDRLSSMLIEIPRPLEGHPPYELDEILELRLTILALFESMCEQKLCSHGLAVHPLALGRLVRVMNDELNAIYESTYKREYRSEIINRAVRVLFYLSSTFTQDVDLQDKLRRQPGGTNKFLITLSRLAFSDAIWYERFISEDVFDCAHQLLENFVTPEEAEALKSAFIREEDS